MSNLGISVLPDIVEVVLLTTAFSAGNSYTYCSSRTLYGLALDGKAPWIFSYCNKDGVPIYSVLITLCWGFLAFLQLGKSASTVLNWIVNLVTAAQLMNFGSMIITYLSFYRACKAQGLDRRTFPFVGWLQPWSGILGLILIVGMLGTQGYQVFLPGNWSVESFLFSYLMIFIDIALFIFWKVLKRTKFRRPADSDLTSGLEEVELHERYIALMEEKQGGPKKHSAWRRYLLDWIVPTQ
ncbi:unnamed protein product [Ambrosiozyma monospora]|uniref:Unnamed protein product n=1 Tax=Ambrosiozyma monospora TaxID=43982 RepID=A0ACB5T5G8_AMBMO|nr:unnamed protein product [Ambrosiozyma monospora]